MKKEFKNTILKNGRNYNGQKLIMTMGKADVCTGEVWTEYTLRQ